MDTGIPKSLMMVGQESLLSRHFRIFESLGVKKFCVISGYGAPKLVEAVSIIKESSQAEIEVVHNERFDLENGFSVFSGRDWAQSLLQEDFFLTMGDHIFHPELVRTFIEKSADSQCKLQLAVDLPGTTNSHIDIEDVTKVQSDRDGYIRSIGKGLSTYNYYDTGLFRLKKSVFDVFQQSFDQKRYTISDSVSRLIESKEALVVQVAGLPWNDVDNRQDLDSTLQLLAEGKM